MKKEAEKALDNFVDLPEEDEKKGAKEVILGQREGLIERVDKVYLTEDGRQLLREHY